MGLRDRDLLRVTVDGGTAGEGDGVAVVLLKQMNEVDGAVEVVGMVEKRQLDALTDGLEAGKVNACLEGSELVEDLSGTGKVHEVALGNKNVLFSTASDLAHTLEGLNVGVVEVIHDDHTVAGIEELDHSVRANVAGTAGNKDAVLA